MVSNNDKKFFEIFFRYMIILLFGLGNLFIFYFIFTPITTYSVYGIVSLYHDVQLGSTGLIYLENLNVSLIDSCIAGGAFYLLFILIMSIGRINFKKRLFVLISSFVLFLFLNISRILFLIELYDTKIFVFAHWFLWNIMSTLFVVGIWFLMVWFYKIKYYPFLTDFYDVLSFFKENNKKENKKKTSVLKKKKAVRKK